VTAVPGGCSICLQPLNSASMTSVDVTSFSLKNCFTMPCNIGNVSPGQLSAGTSVSPFDRSHAGARQTAIAVPPSDVSCVLEGVCSCLGSM